MALLRKYDFDIATYPADNRVVYKVEIDGCLAVFRLNVTIFCDAPIDKVLTRGTSLLNIVCVFKVIWWSWVNFFDDFSPSKTFRAVAPVSN